MNSAGVFEVTLNGMPCGELTLCAAYAGALGIPTVFAAGEKQNAIEALRNLPQPIELVVDEVGCSNQSAVCRPFRSLEPELVAKTRTALSLIGKTPPFDLGPITWKTRYRYPENLRRQDGALGISVRGEWRILRARNMVEAWNRAYAQVRSPKAD